MNQDEARRGGAWAEAIDPKEIAGAIERFARENPHAAVASAWALGFLLGGGLTPRLIGLIATVAGRRYLLETLRATVDSALREQLGGLRSSAEV